MIHRLQFIVAGAALIACASACGCAGRFAFRQARKAEQRGQFHVAYELYCEAGRERPGSTALGACIRRVAPLAADYWEAQADAAVDKGQYAQAWRLFMKALETRPDHRSIPYLIRRLEREHPQAVADAKRKWLQGTQVTTVPVKELAASPSPSVIGSSRSSPEAARALTRPNLSAVPPQMSKGKQPAQPARGFLLTATISRKDSRFPKKAQLIDGIAVKVKDTDSDADAHLHVYVGRKRIKTHKNWRVGEARRVTGRSGRPYEIVVLLITHKTHTVRVGLRRAF